MDNLTDFWMIITYFDIQKWVEPFLLLLLLIFPVNLYLKKNIKIEEMKFADEETQMNGKKNI